MVLVRRWLLLWSLLFWQGGFLFYSAVVVPIGADVLGSAEDQGWITRRVTPWLNVAGAVGLAVWAWDILAESQARRQRRWLVWGLMAVLQITLFVLHTRLNGLLDPERFRIIDRSAFTFWHRTYLWVSTALFLGSVLLSWWTLREWTATDPSAGDAARAE